MGAKTSKAEANKQTKEDLVYDKTPLSIGLSCFYDDMVVQIPKNTAIPTRKFESIKTTVLDNQEAVKLRFYQGERKKASANQLLGALVLKGIPPAPRGVARITVCVDVDAKGNLNVSAEDKSTGRKVTKIIPGVGVEGKLLSAVEVEKMAGQGEKHKSEDKEHSEKVKVMNAMDDYMVVVRENAAAGAYSGKVRQAFKDVAGTMLDEFTEKSKEFGLQSGDKKRCET